MIRRAVKGGEVPPDIGFRVLLYSYCLVFHISPADAMKTPLKLMLEMLQIHAEVEDNKQKEMDREMKKHKK